MMSRIVLLSLAVACKGEMIGFWDWDWGSGSVGPPSSNTKVGFTGLIDVNQALSYSPKPAPGMNNLVSIGGGNAGGMWTPAALQAVSNKTWHAAVHAAGFQGIAFDIEVCTGTIPPADFSAAFAALRASNLTVMVTISHTAPYDCTNKVDLMNAFIPDANINYMSPQLYSSGTEPKPSFAWKGVPFSAFQKMPPSMQMVPSIVDYTQYPAVQTFFKNLSIPLHGYVQWAQVAKVAAEPKTIGFWEWSWGTGDHGPAGANLALSFSGWVDLEKALSQSTVHKAMPTMMSIGGGNANGAWSNAAVQGINATYLARVKARGFVGVAFDIEECSEEVAPEVFSSCFTRVKAANMTVMVTTSHSAPYGCKNKRELMHAFIPDSNVDYISPQLYHTGTEPHPQFEHSEGVTWKDFKKMPATTQFVPSIGQFAEYSDVVTYYSKPELAIPCSGFVQWQQNTTSVL